MIKKGLKFKQFTDFRLVSNSKEELLTYLGRAIGEGRRMWLATPNPEFVIASKKDSSFRAVLLEAAILIPDGIGLIWGLRVIRQRTFLGRFLTGIKTGFLVLGGRLADRVIAGTDLMVDLCALACRKGWPVYFLGGRPGIAQKTLEILKNRFPGLQGEAGTGPWEDFSRKNHGSAEKFWIKEINRFRPRLLFVALGMGKQERFISRNWSCLKVNLAMGVGGAFDQLVDSSLNPPPAFKKSGLGWFYRLWRQPWRWRRQSALLKFIWLTLKG
ncbi:MAG: WecB/TagA/CpsF family glycosyltransferase [Candidatus Pacebacteria bacterium]|nr:WecB/TagA/CpsF family glycosyltransferase [Candidatus Paceibacterota bacterium]